MRAEARSAYLEELRALVAKRQAAAMAADEPIAAGGEASALAELVEWLAQPEAEAAVMNSGGASSSSSSAAAAPAAGGGRAGRCCCAAVRSMLRVQPQAPLQTPRDGKLPAGRDCASTRPQPTH